MINIYTSAREAEQDGYRVIRDNNGGTKMNPNYSMPYMALSQGYKNMQFLIMRKFGTRGSFLYTPKNEIEDKLLGRILEILIADNWELIATNSPETYMEYAPYTPINDVKQFITMAMDTV